MPRHTPLQLDREDIDLLCRVLQFADGHMAKSAEENERIPGLRLQLETNIPYFPNYALIWPGVTEAQVAPFLPDKEDPEATPPGVYELTNDQARVLRVFAESGNPLEAIRTPAALEAIAAKSMAFTLTGDFVIDLQRDGLLACGRFGALGTAYSITAKGLAAFDAWQGRQAGEETLAIQRAQAKPAKLPVLTAGEFDKIMRDYFEPLPEDIRLACADAMRRFNAGEGSSVLALTLACVLKLNTRLAEAEKTAGRALHEVGCLQNGGSVE